MWTTAKQNQKHEEEEEEEHLPLRQSSVYHSHLVSSPFTNSLDFLCCQRRLRWTLVQYFINVFFFTYFSLQVFIFYICYHKKHDMFNKCLFFKKKQLHNECSWCLTRTVTMDLLLCTLSNVWCHLHTEGPICWNLTADGLYYLKNVWLPAKTQLSFSPLVNCAKKLKQQ